MATGHGGPDRLGSIMIVLKFTNVGRGKNNWTAEIDTDQPLPKIEGWILSQIKKHGGLIGRDVSIAYDTGFRFGNIYAGFRKVGTFEIQEAAA